METAYSLKTLLTIYKSTRKGQTFLQSTWRRIFGLLMNRKSSHITFCVETPRVNFALQRRAFVHDVKRRCVRKGEDSGVNFRISQFHITKTIKRRVVADDKVDEIGARLGNFLQSSSDALNRRHGTRVWGIKFQVNRRFGGTCHLHLHGRRISQLRNQLATCFTLIYCLAYSSTLKIATTRYSETSLDFQRTTRCYTQEDRTPKSCTVFEVRNYTKHQDVAINVAPNSEVRIPCFVLLMADNV
jgi:hypothetical protein